MTRHGVFQGTGKSWGWLVHWLCGGSIEIQKAHAGDHRKEDHVQGLFPGALVLLALLSKEEWKLWMVSCKICLSRPCGGNGKQTQKVLLNLLTINSIDTVLLMFNSYLKNLWVSWGNNWQSTKFNKTLWVRLSPSTHHHSIPKTGEALRHRSPIPGMSMDSRALEAGLTCPGHTAWKGDLLPCFALYDLPALGFPEDSVGARLIAATAWEFEQPYSSLPKGCQISIHNDSPHPCKISPSCPLTHTVWDRKGGNVNVSLSLENISTEFLAKRQQYTEVKTRDWNQTAWVQIPSLHLLALWPWAKYFVSLGLGFLIYKTGIIIVP